MIKMRLLENNMSEYISDLFPPPYKENTDEFVYKVTAHGLMFFINQWRTCVWQARTTEEHELPDFTVSEEHGATLEDVGSYWEYVIEETLNYDDFISGLKQLVVELHIEADFHFHQADEELAQGEAALPPKEDDGD